LGKAYSITLLRYIPRSDWTGRMIGGKFQGSNVADFSSGVVDFYTVTSTPTLTWNQVAISISSLFRYVRYLTPSYGYLNVAELEFYSCTNATGISENRISMVDFYPNPASTKIYFSENVPEVDLFNLQGQHLLSASKVNSMDVNSLSKGLYIVKMTTLDGSKKSTKLEIR